MKVLHVIPSIGPLRGGPSAALRVMVAGLAEHGVEVHIAATNDNGRETLDVPLNTPIPEGGATFWYFKRQTRFYTFSWPLTRWLFRNAGNFDLLHIHARMVTPRREPLTVGGTGEVARPADFGPSEPW